MSNHGSLALFKRLMETTLFKIGDTVRLKSGGPLMTVTEVRSDSPSSGKPMVWVKWFSDSEAKQDHFPPDALEADRGGFIGGGGVDAD